MTHEEAIEKIRKVLTLTTSSNEHEAALAAERAQQLLTEYRLTVADIENAEIGRTLMGRKGGWSDVLLMTVATACGCSVLMHVQPLVGGGLAASVFGTWLDRRTAVRLYSQMRPVIEARATTAWAAHVASLQGPFGPHPATTEPGAEAEWTDSYAYGAIERLRKRLLGLEHRDTAEQSTAMVAAFTSRITARSRAADYVQKQYGSAITRLPRHVVIDMGGVREGEKGEL